MTTATYTGPTPLGYTSWRCGECNARETHAHDLPDTALVFCTRITMPDMQSICGARMRREHAVEFRTTAAGLATDLTR